MLAIAKLLHTKSSTVKSCCRFCKIQGHHNRKSLTYYCPPKPLLDGTTTANGSSEFHTNEYDLYNMLM